MDNTYYYEPLDQKQIDAFHREFMEGNTAVGFRIAESVMPLMVDLAHKYYPTCLQRMGVDDFRQEIILHIFERLHLYESQKGTITTWAGWELRHYANDKFRRAGDLIRVPIRALSKGIGIHDFYSDYDFDDLDSGDIEPWEYAVLNEDEEKANALVDLLIRVAPFPAKETVRLRYKVGMNLEQIAQHFGVSRQAIDQRCQTAHQALTQHYRMKERANAIGRNNHFARV